MGRPQSTARRVLMLSLALSLASSTTVSLQANAISIGLNNKKSSSFQLPAAEKIDENDLSSFEENNPDLAPLTLNEQPKSTAGGTSTTGSTTTSAPPKAEDGALNATVTTTNFVPKGPLEGDHNPLMTPMSVSGGGGRAPKDVGKLGGSILEQAKSVNAAPLPLIESADEADQKADDARENEKEQITALWEAALTRSPDINFVIQKLMPASDHAKVTTVMMRLLSTAVMTGVGGMNMMAPSAANYMIGSASVSTLQNLLQFTDSKAAKAAKLTQTEQIMMFQMVRKNADSLVEHYRNYKKNHILLARANNDFEDFKKVAADARKTQDAATQLQIEYTLRKQQRDIESIGQDLAKCRQSLVDMSGGEAVAKLDQQIDEEFTKLHPDMMIAQPENNQIMQEPGSEPVKQLAEKSDETEKSGEKTVSHFKVPQM